MTSQHACYVFVDLDALVASVTLQVRSHPNEFRDVVERIPVADIALDIRQLAAILDDAQPTTVCRRGCYFRPHVPYGGALTALGWDMKKKGAAHHCTLENLFKQAYQSADTSIAPERRTVVLATGILTLSVVRSLEAFLQANWRVQLVFLQFCEQAIVQQLRRTYVTQLTCVYLDRLIRDLVVHREQLTPSVMQQQQSVLVQDAPLQALQYEHSRGQRSESPPPASAPAPARATAPRTVIDKSPAGIEQRIAAKKSRELRTTPSEYTFGARQRFVLMDFDNITAGLHSSHRLYERVPGARSGYDLYMSLRALTTRICGDDPTLVKKQLATYFRSNKLTALALRAHRWSVLKQETVSDMTLQLELLENLVACTDSAPSLSSLDTPKTLVLVTGDGNVPPNGKPFPMIVKRYLRQNWHVEVHAWLHAISDSYIQLQRAYPQHLVVRPLNDVFDDIVSLKLSVGAPVAVAATATASQDAECAPALSVPSASASLRGDEGAGGNQLPMLTPQHLQKLHDAFVALRVAAVQRGELPLSVLDARPVCVQDDTSSDTSDPLTEPDAECSTLDESADDDDDGDDASGCESTR